MADTAHKKTGMRLRLQSEGVCQAERHGKKLSKVMQGEVLPLDRSLLMSEFPTLRWQSVDYPAAKPWPWHEQPQQCRGDAMQPAQVSVQSIDPVTLQIVRGALRAIQ